MSISTNKDFNHVVKVENVNNPDTLGMDRPRPHHGHRQHTSRTTDEEEAERNLNREIRHRQREEQREREREQVEEARQEEIEEDSSIEDEGTWLDRPVPETHIIRGRVQQEVSDIMPLNVKTMSKMYCKMQ